MIGRLAIGLIALASVGVPAIDQGRTEGTPASANQIMDLARRGDVEGAWILWSRLAGGPDKQQLGMRLAAETRLIARGLEIYDEVTVEGQKPDRAALATLALGAAAEFAESSDVEMKASACGAALLLEPAHQPCRRALEAMTDAKRGADEQAFAIGALANARIAPYPERLAKLTLRPNLRLRFAQTLTGLPPAERLALVRPLLGDPDQAVQYQTILILSDVPGAEVSSALKGLQPAGPVRMALTVALARHGDAASRPAVREMLSNLDGYLKIQAGRALAEAGDARGRDVLQAMLGSPVDIDRVYAAEALAPINPTAARRAILDGLATLSAAVQPAALHVAGRIGAGLERPVYRRLAGGAPADRAGAVMAVAETLRTAARPPGLRP